MGGVMSQVKQCGYKSAGGRMLLFLDRCSFYWIRVRHLITRREADRALVSEHVYFDLLFERRGDDPERGCGVSRFIRRIHQYDGQCALHHAVHLAKPSIGLLVPNDSGVLASDDVDY